MTFSDINKNKYILYYILHVHGVYMRNDIQYQDNQARAKSELTVKKRHLYKLQLEWHSVENVRSNLFISKSNTILNSIPP